MNSLFPFCVRNVAVISYPDVIQPGDTELTFNEFLSSFLSLARLDVGSPYMMLIFWLTKIVGLWPW